MHIWLSGRQANTLYQGAWEKPVYFGCQGGKQKPAHFGCQQILHFLAVKHIKVAEKNLRILALREVRNTCIFWLSGRQGKPCTFCFQAGQQILYIKEPGKNLCILAVRDASKYLHFLAVREASKYISYQGGWEIPAYFGCQGGKENLHILAFMEASKYLYIKEPG